MTRRQKLIITSAGALIVGIFGTAVPATADAPGSCPAAYGDLDGVVRDALLPGEEHWFLHIYQYDFLNPSSGITYDVVGNGGGWAEISIFDYDCGARAACQGTYRVAAFAGPLSLGSCTTSPASHFVRVVWHDNGDEDGPVDYVLKASQKVRMLS